MGKIFHCNKSGLKIIVILSLLLFSVLNVDAAYQEFDLFNQGYKHYLSYQPEKAVEEFRLFLKEFPDSSARDAVLFWLGKALIQLKSFEEAKNVFSEIKKQFPESPFIAFVNKESDAILKSDAEVKKDMPDEAKVSVKTPVSENREDILKTEIQKFEEERKAKEAKEVKESKEVKEVKEEKGVKEQQEQVKLLPKEEKTELLQTKEIKSEPGAKKDEPSVPSSFLRKKGLYTVQAGVFKQKKNVDDLSRKFIKEGYPVKVVPVTLQGESSYKVMVGEFATRRDAEAFVLRLKKIEGINATIKMSEVTEKRQTSKADVSKATGEKEKENLPAEPEKKETAGKKEELSMLSPSTQKGVVYSVQAGAYKKRAKAEALKNKYEKAGYPCKVATIIVQNENIYKVMIGEFSTKEDADVLAMKLKRTDGVNTIVRMTDVAGKTQFAEAGLPETAGGKEIEKEIPSDKSGKLEKEQPGVKAGGFEGGQVRTESVQSQVREDKETLLNEPEKRETVEAGIREKEATESNDLQPGIQELQMKQGGDEQKGVLSQDTKEKHPASTVQALNDEQTKTENQTGRIQGPSDSSEGLEIKIRDKTYTVSEIFEYMTDSLSLMHKLDIREVLWRKGDTYEDFTNEHLLYHEAKDLLITIDEKKLNEAAAQYNLNTGEAEYLKRFLMISELIDIKIKELPEERIVESLMVRYKGMNQQAREEFATVLQTDIKNNVPFEDISKSHPDIVKFQKFTYEELQEWIKERIISLQNGEIGFIWTEDGSLVLRPMVKKLSYYPFEDLGGGLREKIRAFVKAYIGELRKGIKGS